MTTNEAAQVELWKHIACCGGRTGYMTHALLFLMIPSWCWEYRLIHGAEEIV